MARRSRSSATGTRSRAALVLVMLGAATLAACSVAESYKVGIAPGEVDLATTGQLPEGRCKSDGGSYSLSMTTWSFEIASYGDAQPYVLEKIEERRNADNRHIYCLDYVASALADDKLEVGYTARGATGGGGLLDYVTSFAVDQSIAIAKNLIRAIFIGISRDANFTVRFGQAGTNRKTLGRFEVDPLDAEEMTALNRRLADFGFCLVLDGYTVDRSLPGPEYCGNPQRMLADYPSYELKRERQKSWFVEHPERTGILYRPRIPYWLDIYTQSDPRHSAWELRKRTQVHLENLAPIVSLRVNRALFAKARVGLDFEGGVLKNHCVAKSSELREFIEIPLEIVYGVVKLPAEAVRTAVDNARNSPEVARAEGELIADQRKFIEFERTRELRASAPPAGSNGLPNRAGCSGGVGCNASFQPAAAFDPAFLDKDTNGVCATLDGKVPKT